MNLDKLKNGFIYAAILHGEATEKGDYKLANKQYKILVKVVNELKQENDAIRELEELLNSEYDYVRLWAATFFLQVDEEKASYILKQLTNNKSIIGFTAETTLNEWKKGNLRL